MELGYELGSDSVMFRLGISCIQLIEFMVKLSWLESTQLVKLVSK